MSWRATRPPDLAPNRTRRPARTIEKNCRIAKIQPNRKRKLCFSKLLRRDLNLVERFFAKPE